MKKENPNDYGEFIASDAVRITRLLPGPMERVWAYLTEPDKRATWLAGGPMDLHIGGRVELNFRHGDLSPKEEAPEKYRDYQCGHKLDGRITHCEPPRLLGYTWDDASENPSEVIFELMPRDGDVLLVITHRRLDRTGMVNVAAGWHIHLAIMAARLDGTPPPLFWATHARLENEYEGRIAAKKELSMP